MVETCVRVVILTLISLVVAYYAYLLAQAHAIIKCANMNPVDEREERVALLKRKIVPTVSYLLCMVAIGVLYIIGIDIVVMSYVLMLLSVIIAFIGDKRILSKADLKKN